MIKETREYLNGLNGDEDIIFSTRFKRWIFREGVEDDRKDDILTHTLDTAITQVRVGSSRISIMLLLQMYRAEKKRKIDHTLAPDIARLLVLRYPRVFNSVFEIRPRSEEEKDVLLKRGVVINETRKPTGFSPS